MTYPAMTYSPYTQFQQPFPGIFIKIKKNIINNKFTIQFQPQSFFPQEYGNLIRENER